MCVCVCERESAYVFVNAFVCECEREECASMVVRVCVCVPLRVSSMPVYICPCGGACIVCTCKRIFVLSKGAITVLEMAPAPPPVYVFL